MTPQDASSPENLPNCQALSTGSLAAGARLGPYQLVAAIGAGGMGEVWKARDTRLNRIVALKISKTGFGGRFEQEARAVAALNHPNICTLYDVGPNYFVMEYIEGKPLHGLIPRKGLDLPQVLNYAVQITDALAAAHAAGIVHRDLKPGNIMVTTDGRVKVVDFGLARVAPSGRPDPEEPTYTVTAEGTIAGTVSYMSPEQAQGEPVDGRSDIFSFGAVLYEMLTGSRPFPGDSTVAILANILKQEPLPVVDLPRDVERLLNRCLRKDPARRWQSMADLNVALLELKEDSASGMLAVPPEPSLRKRRTIPMWAAGVGALVLLGASAAWYFPRRQPAPAVASAPVPLTSYTGLQTHPSFSPDGNQVAFSWNGPQRDNWDIYVKVVGEGEPLRLTSGPVRKTSPAWSPDGRWIAFAQILSEGRYSLMLISPLGGAERKLGEFGAPYTRFDLSFAWSNDSRYLVIPVHEPSNHRNGLFRFTVETGDLLPLTPLDMREPGDTAPAVSPDGRSLAFVRAFDLNLGRLCLLRLGPDYTPEGAVRVIAQRSGPGVAWAADGNELVFPLATLRRVVVDGSAQPQPIAVVGNAAIEPSISRSNGSRGSRLAWSRSSSDANIYRLELSTGSQQASNPRPWIASVFRDTFPQYSPDGKRIAFYSQRSGLLEIWVCEADGSSPRKLSRIPGLQSMTPRWSPDGKRIAFDVFDGSRYGIHVMGADGGVAERLTDPSSSNFASNWSVDGRWLYFTSNRAGDLNIWKMPSAGGAAVQVTRNGGGNPTVSPDGRYLYYVKSFSITESSLWRAPLEAEGETQLVARIHRFSYAVTARGVFYSVPLPGDTGGTIEFLDPDTGRHSILFRTDKRFDSGLAVSPDGRYLLYPQIDSEGSNLMMIENFR